MVKKNRKKKKKKKKKLPNKVGNCYHSILQKKLKNATVIVKANCHNIHEFDPVMITIFTMSKSVRPTSDRHS